MKASELRIGNLIFLELGLPSLNVHTMTDSDFKDIDNDPRVMPIPLTEEWLLKFGFKEDSIFGIAVKYSLNGIDIWYNKKLHDFLLDNLKNKTVYIKHVHKLQNLYFALTGTELIINP